jgi:hypothetical protein
VLVVEMFNVGQVHLSGGVGVTVMTSIQLESSNAKIELMTAHCICLLSF